MFGRAFVNLYYKLSPSLVRHFGRANWFSRLWRGGLDVLVKLLRDSGVSDAEYDDGAMKERRPQK
jgi:hypothetical protein